MRPTGSVPRSPALALAAALLAAAVGALAAAPEAVREALRLLAAGGLVAPVPLYSRLDRHEVLDDDTRRTIYEIVKSDPGVCVSEICEEVGVAWGTAVYHLRVLEENHLVAGLKHGRHRRFFENGGAHEGQKEALATLQNETTAEIFSTIREDPGLPQKEIADRVDLSPQALTWHIDRLEDADLLERERDGRLVRHYARREAAPASA